MDRAARRRSFGRELSCMVYDGAQAYCIDPANELFRLLGKSWVLPLIGVLGNRKGSRFNEIQDAIGPIGSKVLTQRLRDLLEFGLVERKAFAEVPVRVEYRLSRRGEALRASLIPLLAWSAERTERVDPERSVDG